MKLITKSSFMFLALIVACAAQVPSAHAGARVATANQFVSGQTVVFNGGTSVQQSNSWENAKNQNLTMLNNLTAINQTEGQYTNNVTECITINNSWLRGKTAVQNANIYDQNHAVITNNISKTITVKTGRPALIAKR